VFPDQAQNTLKCSLVGIKTLLRFSGWDMFPLRDIKYPELFPTRDIDYPEMFPDQAQNNLR
jgi:hypothetical protein